MARSVYVFMNACACMYMCTKYVRSRVHIHAHHPRGRRYLVSLADPRYIKDWMAFTTIVTNPKFEGSDEEFANEQPKHRLRAPRLKNKKPQHTDIHTYILTHTCNMESTVAADLRLANKNGHVIHVYVRERMGHMKPHGPTLNDRSSLSMTMAPVHWPNTFVIERIRLRMQIQTFQGFPKGTTIYK
jgi:hypothetical protein